MGKLIYIDALLYDDIIDYTSFLFGIEYCIKYSKETMLSKLLHHYQHYTKELRNSKKIISKRYGVSYECVFIQYAFYNKNQIIAQTMLDLFDYSLDINVYTDAFI
jgi:hypothetical protein